MSEQGNSSNSAGINEDIPQFQKFQDTFENQDSISLDSNFDDNQKWEQHQNLVVTSKYQPSVFDVAEYILQICGPISTIKLRKLVYYCQAWSLVWLEEPIFPETIEAWTNGPVVRTLFDYHRGQFQIDHIPIGNPNILSPVQKECVRSVVEFYGDMTAQYLIDLTHLEKPWRETRGGMGQKKISSKPISLASMAEYYSSL